MGPAENGNLSVMAVDKDQSRCAQTEHWHGQREDDLLKSEPFPLPGTSWQALTTRKQQVPSNKFKTDRLQSTTMISVQQASEDRRDSGVEMSVPVIPVQTMCDLCEEDVGYWTGDEDYYVVQQREAATEHRKLIDSVARWLDDISLDPLTPNEATPAEDDSNEYPLLPSKSRATAVSIQRTPRRFKIPARNPVTPVQGPTRFLSAKLPTPYLVRTFTPVAQETHLPVDNGFHGLHSAFSSSPSASPLEDAAKDPRRASEVFCRNEGVAEHEAATPDSILVPNELIPLSPGVQTYRKGKRGTNRRQFSTVSDEILGLNDQERRNMGLWTGLCGVAAVE